MIGSFLEEHIIFPAGQHKIILWNRLTIINICLLWTTSKQCSFSSSVCKKNKTVTLHSPLKQEVEFKRTRLSPAQEGRLIQLHLFSLLRLLEDGRASTRLQSRRMALFVLEQASLERKHFVNQIVHDVPCRHEETIQELWILEFWFLSNYFFSTANICPLWMARKNPGLDASSIETQSMFESSSHSVLTEYGLFKRQIILIDGI